MIAACVKWLAELGEPGDERFGGISLADQAALEMALRHGELTSEPVTVVAVGGVEAESTLRDALACGASRAVRVVAGGVGPPLDSVDVASCLAQVVTGAPFVWCGDISSDRGSGSTPAFLTGLLGARQALGAIAVTLGDGHSVDIVRRLDGGRREVLRASAPCVVSVEGSVARLRRAGFAATLRARDAAIERLDIDVPAAVHAGAPLVRPFRPRARALAAPRGDTLERLRALTDAGGTPTHGERVALEPPQAAERILGALREWGYLG